MSIDIAAAPKLFGGYIESLSSGAGYGADGGSCQISLVFENDGPLRPYDLDRNFPELGTAVGIKWGEFEFGGILQRFTHKRSLDGYKYDVIIESPGKWLDGVQIITEGFQGTTFPAITHNHPQTGDFLPSNKFNTENNYIFTNDVNNIWNPFAVLENYQYGGNFGNSDINSAGFPAKSLLSLIEEISRGEHPFGGKAVFGESEYEVDLSELIPIVPEFFRVKGPHQSLNSIIQECCEISIHDYIVFVKPKRGSISNGIIEKPVIKIKVVDKREPPNPDTIKIIVNQYEREKKLVSADFGKEFSDTVTQKLVIGGPASRHVMSSPYNFYPVWGKTAGIRPQYIIGNRTVSAGGMDMFASVQVSLNSGAMYNATVLEVRCAMSSFETWILYKALMGDSLLAKFSKIRIDDYAINGLINRSITSEQLFNTDKEAKQVYGPYYQGSNPYDEIQKIYNAVKTVGDQFYGKRFFVPLPFEPGGIDNNIKFINEDQQYITSWKLADSAWVDNKPFSDVSFYDGDGRLKAVSSWIIGNQFDYSGLGSEYAFGMGGIASVVNVEKDIYWQNLGSIALPYCIVEVKDVLNFDQYTTDKLGAGHLLKLIRGIDVDSSSLINFGSDDGSSGYGIAPAKQAPTFISIPQESNRYTWGPWWRYSSKKGKAEIESDTSLTPETFGSSSVLNSVGYAYAFVSGANVAGNESGYVEVAEVPVYNLAERFAVSGPYVSNIDINYGIDGVRTTYKFNTWTPQFGKLAKYNADRISRINKSTIRFLQEQRERFIKPPLPQKTVMDIMKSKFIPSLAGAPSRIMGRIVQGQNGAKMVTVAPSHNQTAMVVTAAPGNDDYGCTPEQIFTPAKIEKPNDNDPNTLNPYFAFAKTDFVSVAGEGQNTNDNFQENADKFTAVKTIALRGPLLVSGWGYDTSGNPVPAKEGNETQFHENTGTDRTLWKTGPVDLQWDDNRKMWVAGGLGLIEGVLISPITAPSTPFDNSTQFTIQQKKKDGDNFSNGEEINVINRDPYLSVSLNQANAGKILVVAAKINQEWRPLWVSCPE